MRLGSHPRAELGIFVDDRLAADPRWRRPVEAFIEDGESLRAPACHGVNAADREFGDENRTENDGRCPEQEEHGPAHPAANMPWHSSAGNLTMAFARPPKV